jgi:glycosyltransferase involved in cell wall biosynthesis
MMNETPSARPLIVFAGFICLPQESAATNRNIYMATALREAGYDVWFLVEKPAGREEDRQPDGTYWYRGFRYIPIGVPRSFRQARTLRSLLVLDSPSGRWFAEQAPANVAGVILYAGYSGQYAEIQRWGRERGVPIYGDVVEYQAARFILPVGGLRAWIDYEVRTNHFQTRCTRLIVISSFLERMYRARGKDTLRVLPLIDTREPCWAPVIERPPHEEIRVLFVGSPGRDRQDLILEGVRLARIGGVPVRLTYAGASRERLLKLPGVTPALIDALGDAVTFHEWVPYDALPDTVAEADYCLLFRPDERCMRAGFPSKTPEMLAKGTPLLCNLTTDLGDYIRDGENGLIVPALTAEDLADTLVRAAQLPTAQRTAMRAAARRTAETDFDYRTMVDPLRAFLAAGTKEAQR